MEHVFTLEPDEPETPHRPTRQVSTGLAPTADVPTRRQQDADTCALQPCPLCGTALLTAYADEGTSVQLDPATPTYVVQWDPGTPQPRAVPSRGYAVHRCGG